MNYLEEYLKSNMIPHKINSSTVWVPGGIIKVRNLNSFAHGSNRDRTHIQFKKLKS